MERRFEACAPDEGVVDEHRLLSQLLGGVNGGDSARHALCAESDTEARTGERVLSQLPDQSNGRSKRFALQGLTYDCPPFNSCWDRAASIKVKIASRM